MYSRTCRSAWQSCSITSSLHLARCAREWIRGKKKEFGVCKRRGVSAAVWMSLRLRDKGGREGERVRATGMMGVVE